MCQERLVKQRLWLVVIAQDDRFDATASITVCVFTTDPAETPLLRLAIEPSEQNGLAASCRLMVDKITTVPKAKVGRLDDPDIIRLDRALLVFLDLAAREEGGVTVRTSLCGVVSRGVGNSRPNRNEKKSLVEYDVPYILDIWYDCRAGATASRHCGKTENTPR